MLDHAMNKCCFCGCSKLIKFKANASDTAVPSKVDIMECKQCGFAWQYPLACSESQSKEFFEDAYIDGGKNNSTYFSDNHKQKIARLEFNFINSFPVSSKTLLDVGAGSGIFASIAADHNWQVTALDPALMLSGDSCCNFQSIKGSIKDVPADQKFDVITLWDVIEHVSDPLDLINSACLHLKDDGFLVIETGNYKSADRISQGLNHWTYQQDHRWYFSPESAKAVLEEAGFIKFLFCEETLRPGWSGSVGYPGPSRLQFIKKAIKDPFHIAKHFSQFLALQKAKHWEMSGIDIFTVAAQK